MWRWCTIEADQKAESIIAQDEVPPPLVKFFEVSGDSFSLSLPVPNSRLIRFVGFF